MAKTALIEGASGLCNTSTNLPPQELVGESQGQATSTEQQHQKE
jgi:hypothetical protein